MAILLYDQSAYVAAFIYSICWILSGNTDASTWPVIFEMSIPFDTNTTFGWYFLLIYTSCADVAFLSCLIFGTTLFIGYCIYITAICDHFDSKMQTIQANVEQNLRERNLQKFDESSGKLNAQIREAIQIHIKIYE